MKKLHQSFDVDSRSTQEKDRKFSRKGTSPSPKASSNKSHHSLSKFWVKNLKVSASGKQLTRTILSTSSRNESDSEQKRSCTDQKDKQDSLTNFYKQQLIDKQNVQIKRLNIQIQKNRFSLESLNKKMADLQKKCQDGQRDNKLLQQKLNQKQSEVKRLETQIKFLSSKVNQKDTLLNAGKKQPSQLSKIKSTIIQTRAQEHLKERERLQNQIKQLELQLHRQKDDQIDTSFSDSLATNHPDWSLMIGYQQNQQNDKALRQELYEVKEELKKMEISAICIHRKHFKQMQTLREWKQKEYQELRKKYHQLLEKYRMCMKKKTSDQINNYKVQKEQKQQKRRKSSIDSADSLALSSDSEMKMEGRDRVTSC